MRRRKAPKGTFWRGPGGGYKPTVATSDGRYARTIRSLRSRGAKEKEIDR
jgi:hypothetical protein